MTVTLQTTSVSVHKLFAVCVSIQQLKLLATYIGHICITLIVEIFVVSSIFPGPSVLLHC